jgi:uncharacterized protein (TIGR03435 family)
MSTNMVRSSLPFIALPLVAAAVVGLCAVAQNSQGDHTDKARSSAEPEKGFKFEVFAIKPTSPDGPAGSLNPTPNGFTTKFNLSQAVVFAYGPPVPPSMWGTVELRNQPSWFVERYAFDARVSQSELNAWQHQNANHDLLRSALRAALKERCKLALHEEPAQRRMIELVLTKRGPRLKAADPNATPPQGTRLESGGIQTFINGGREGWNFHGATMLDLAYFLSLISPPVPVRDRTGLTGRYDFSLRRDPGVSNADLLDSLPLGDLGLQLKPGRENRPILVLDHVERPIPN